MQHRQLEFRVATNAIQGKRDYQEDAVRLWSPENSDPTTGNRKCILAVLSDGMGGHVSGEVASNLVCERSIHFLASNWQAADDQIGSVLDVANSALEQAVQNDGRLRGMGCTAIVALIDSDGLRWASVGDSTLLLYRNNQLRRLNEDHSLGALLDRQADESIISHEDARNSPNRRSLRSALTGTPIALADIQQAPERLVSGDWVILASDGIETLTGDEIATIIAAHGRRNPQDLVEKLLQEVHLKNLDNQDNASIVAIRVDEANESNRTIRVGPPGDTEVVPSLARGRVVGHTSLEGARGQTRRAGAGGGLLLVKALVAVAVLAIAGAVTIASLGLMPNGFTLLGAQSSKSDIPRVGRDPAKQER